MAERDSRAITHAETHAHPAPERRGDPVHSFKRILDRLTTRSVTWP